MIYEAYPGDLHKMFNETYKGHVFKTMDTLKNGHKVLYLTEAVDGYTRSVLPDSERKKFLKVAKESINRAKTRDMQCDRNHNQK